MQYANYDLIDGIKIYDGTTKYIVNSCQKRIDFYKSNIKDNSIFTDLKPSTITVKGKLSNVRFEEKDLINKLCKPTKHILKIGCNYGEKFNPRYIPKEKKTKSKRGRRPKDKKKTRRKVQGTGRYFNSQITFVIEHPTTGKVYQIKLFRNGVVQVPGIQVPLMTDLVEHIKILRDYLKLNFPDKDIQIINIIAVMRNYIVHLSNKFYHVDLTKLENIFFKEKYSQKNKFLVSAMLSALNTRYRDNIKNYLGNYNYMKMAEMTYNKDRCFSLNIKFYRPNIEDPSKKTTIKLLKKGKVNFDGGNSQLEILDLYYYLMYIYEKHKDEILHDIRLITPATPETSDCSLTSIYSSGNDSENNIDAEG